LVVWQTAVASNHEPEHSIAQCVPSLRIRFQGGQKADRPAFITTHIQWLARQAYRQWFLYMFQTISVTFTGNTVNRQAGFNWRQVSATALHLAADRDDESSAGLPKQLIVQPFHDQCELANNPYTFGILEIVIQLTC
jgi:hypothetical protein